MTSRKIPYIFLSLIVFWVIYTILYGISKNISFLHGLTGYLAFVGETGLDVICVIVSWHLVKATKGNAKIFFTLLFISFIFSALSDGAYNIILNIYGNYHFQPLIESIFDFPFLLFLILQLAAWFLMFLVVKNQEKPHFKAIFYIPLIISCLTILFVFIFVPVWQIKYASTIGFYMLADTFVELLAFVFITICLGASINKNLLLMAIGFMLVIASDFIIRFSEVSRLLFPGSPLETIWVLGLIFMAYGLYKFKSDPNINQPKKWVCGWNSIQLQSCFWGFSLCVTSLIVFFLINSIFSMYGQRILPEPLLQNIPSILILFSILSVIISNLMAYQLSKPFSQLESLVDRYTGKDYEKKLPKPNDYSITEFKRLEACLITGLKAIRDKTAAEKILTKTALQVSKEVRAPLNALKILSTDIDELKGKKRQLIQTSINEITVITNSLIHQFERPTDQILNERSQEDMVNKQIVLVDDNVPLTLTWEMAAEEANIKLSVYLTSPELLDNLAQYDKNTFFYIDINLGDHCGIELSKTLFEKGYKNLYLITGRKMEDYPNVDWVNGILGIESPF